MSWVSELTAVKREIDDTEWAITENERRFQVDRAADLKYKDLPRLQDKYASLLESIKDANFMVADAVRPDHIAAVVARWSGVPVEKVSDLYSVWKLL